MPRRVLLLAIVVAATSACSHRPVDSLRDLCPLAELPATTPDALDALKATTDSTLGGHSGKASANTEQNKRIFLAAVHLQFAASQAAVEARATGSQKSLLELFHSGEPQIIPTVTEAQDELRDACKS
jgi:hypothetical protein